jgi:hypothetical protein
LKECKRIFDCNIDGKLVEINGIKKSTAEIVIPGFIDGMPVVLGRGAFGKNKKLEKVVFSEGVQAIGSDAFAGCKQLKEVVFASSIKDIGSGAFINIRT